MQMYAKPETFFTVRCQIYSSGKKTLKDFFFNGMYDLKTTEPEAYSEHCQTSKLECCW